MPSNLLIISMQVDEIAADLMDSDLATRVDKSTASLGRRYARADEIGIPYCITVDFETAEDKSVTVRDRNTTKQDRIKISELKEYLLKKLH